VPKIDIPEAGKDKDVEMGQVVLLGALFAPFTHDYLWENASVRE